MHPRVFDSDAAATAILAALDYVMHKSCRWRYSSRSNSPSDFLLRTNRTYTIDEMSDRIHSSWRLLFQSGRLRLTALDYWLSLRSNWWTC
jgi:hypothetical protein